MSQRIFITSTPLNRLRPLSWQGVQAITCYDQFSRILQSRLGPAHFALLAEPLLDNQALTADWYAWLPENAVQTQAVKLIELAPELQTQMRDYMISLGRPVFELAQELKQSGDSNSSTAGTLLEMALTFPGEEFIYVLGNQPVLTGWGFAPDKANAVPEQLTRLRAAPVAPAAETQKSEEGAVAGAGLGAAAGGTPDFSDEPAARGKSAVPWAVLAFLIGALIAGLLLYFLRPESFDLGGSCSRVLPADNATAEGPSELRQDILRAQGSEEILRAELERLRREYHYRLLQCQEIPEDPPVAETPPPVEPEPAPPAQEDEVAPPVPQLAMPELPPDPPPAPKPKADPAPTPDPAPSPKPKSDHLEIPDSPTDLAFLEGCWEAEIAQGTPGRYATTPQRLVYCFDESGKGSGVLSDRNNGEKICVGGAKGELRGDSLRIKDKPPLRPRTCIPETITCRNASSGVAECSSVFEDGGTSKLVFRRR